jgi:hypothetical protein
MFKFLRGKETLLTKFSITVTSAGVFNLLFCAMDLFENLVKRTESLSEKFIVNYPLHIFGERNYFTQSNVFLFPILKV